MTRTHSLARLGALAAAVAAAGVTLLPAPATASAAVDDVSWWTRSPLAAPPEGGFGVGAAPDGPTSVAAVTVDLGDGVDTLVLAASPSGEVASPATLEVCLAPSRPSPSDGDALEEAPVLACEADAVPFGRAGDTWRADVSSLVTGATGAATLAVVPAAGTGTVPYEVAFEAPTVEATDATPADEGDERPPPPTTTPARPGGGTAAPAPPPIRLDPVTTPAPNRSALSTAPPTTAPPADPATAPTGDPSGADEAGSAFELASGGLVDAEASAPRWGEAVVLVLIGMAVGAVVYGGSRFAEARA